MADVPQRVTVLGDGGWGTAFSLVLLEAGREVTLWGHDAAYLEKMERTRRNPRFLPDVPLPDALRFAPEMDEALAEADLVVVAIPTAYLPGVAASMRGAYRPDTPVLSLTKGIDRETLRLPSECLRQTLETSVVAVLSGPSHAEEVARRLPASVTVAAETAGLAGQVQEAVMTDRFRVYTSRDRYGVELGGALKNVIALAAGICVGMELGDNALAALVTRGLAEIAGLGAELGANPITFSGLSGLGDLVTTCISPHGRNRAVGLRLGRGESLEAILDSMEQVAEGVHTARSALQFGRQAGVEMPITQQVCRILDGEASPRDALEDLMGRKPCPEVRSEIREAVEENGAP